MIRLLPLLFLIACSTTPKKETGVLASQCGPTAIKVSDLDQLGFKSKPGKVGVMRIFASWCPYCKEDFIEIGTRFKKGDYTPKDTEVYLLAFKNSREDNTTFEEFKNQTFKTYGIPLENTQIVYVNKGFTELGQTPSTSGEAVFTGWQGMPFALVFGKDGRLAFRGHFTTSPMATDSHYAFIQDLIKETCP